jgi:hypothetical protein
MWAAPEHFLQIRFLMKISFCVVALSILATGCDNSTLETKSGKLVSTSPQAKQGPPTVADGFVLRPTFETTLGSIQAGTAFPVTVAGYDRPIILTAMHLLGPGGGLPSDVPATDVGRVVKAISLREAFDPTIEIAKPGSPITIADAAPLGTPSAAGDIFAFWGPEGTTLPTARLATEAPEPGERVWLAASVLGGAPPNQRLHAATVVGIHDGLLIYRHDNSALELRATSGAPVLNAAGEVVAINLGSGMHKGSLVASGNVVSRFAPRLEAALKIQK